MHTDESGFENIYFAWSAEHPQTSKHSPSLAV